MPVRAVLFLAFLVLGTPVFAQVDLSVGGLDPWTYADPGAPYALAIRLGNLGSDVAQDAVLTVQLPPDTSFAGSLLPCTADGSLVTCTLGPLHPNEFLNPAIDIVTPPQFGGVQLPFTLTVRHSGADANPGNNARSGFVRLYTTFVVDNTNDDGPGSLRQAMHSANAGDCGMINRCKVTFRFAQAPAGGWHTIQPRSALPILTADFTGIDGAIQTWLTGDSNPLGPEIEINGSLAGPANGFVIENAGDLIIRGLAVNGFAANGIEFRGSPDTDLSITPRMVTRNYIGTNPTGTRAVMNGMRGVSSFGYGARIVENVISGNAMSGIFWWGGAGTLNSKDIFLIEKNRIGVQAHADEPLGNGASGVFLGPHAIGADAGDNVIAFNRHFGIAVADVKENALVRNRIFGNGGSSIDIYLDGRTPVAGSSAEAVPMPVLTSVTYDPSPVNTRITGYPLTAPGLGFAGTYSIELFTSDGNRIAHEFIARVDGLRGDFVIDLPFKITAKYVTATLTRIQTSGFLRAPAPDADWQGIKSHTSEISDPIAVR